MGDRDAEHTLNELQEARAEIDRLRELLRWREVGKEFPEESGAYIVANKTNCFMIITAKP